MSKRVIKFLLLTTVLVVSLLVLVACDRGGNEPAQEDPTPQPQQEQPAATPAPTPAEQQVVEEDFRPLFGPYANVEHDFGGRTIRMTYNFDLNLVPGRSLEIDRFLERIAFFEDRWNFNFEILNLEMPNAIFQAHTITSIMAGDHPGEIMYSVSPLYFPSFPIAGLSHAVCQFGILDQYLDMGFPQLLIRNATINDRIYAFNEYFPGRYVGVHANLPGVFFNPEIFELENLPSPYDLVRSGEWTWEKMIELAEAITRDTVGDGEITQFGLSGVNIEQRFAVANGARIVGEMGGVFSFGLLEPNALEAIQFVADSFQSPIWGELGPGWQVPMRGMSGGNVGMLVHEFWISRTHLNPENMPGPWGWVPMPAGPSAGPDFANFAAEMSMLFIPSSVRNPEEVLKVFEAITKDPLYSPDDWIFAVEYRVHTQDTIDMLAIGRQIPLVVDAMSGIPGLTPLINNALLEVRTGEQSAVGAMESVLPQIDALLADVYARDLRGEAIRTLARDAALPHLAAFEDFIITVEGQEPTVDLEDNEDELRALVEVAESYLQAALDVGHTEEALEGFPGWVNFNLVREALAELE